MFQGLSLLCLGPLSLTESLTLVGLFGVPPILFIFAFVLALLKARQQSHRGHWWGKYVLGLHGLLQPLFITLSKHAPVGARSLTFVYQCLTLPFGIELPLASRVGRGITLSHTFGIVVHAQARIGNYCTLHSGVVLGGKGQQDPPCVGNNVYIGANSVIAGSVTIGDNATIGACCLITKDVPANTLVGQQAQYFQKENYVRSYNNQLGIES